MVTEPAPFKENSAMATVPDLESYIKDEISSVVTEDGTLQGTTKKKAAKDLIQSKQKSALELQPDIKSAEIFRMCVESSRIAAKKKLVTEPSPSEKNGAAATLPKIECDIKDEISSVVVEDGTLKGTTKKNLFKELIQFVGSAVASQPKILSEMDVFSSEQGESESASGAKTKEIGNVRCNLSVKPKIERDEDEVSSLLVEAGCSRGTTTKNLDHERLTRSKPSIEEAQPQNWDITDNQWSSGFGREFPASTPPHMETDAMEEVSSLQAAVPVGNHGESGAKKVDICKRKFPLSSQPMIERYVKEDTWCFMPK